MENDKPFFQVLSNNFELCETQQFHTRKGRGNVITGPLTLA